MNKKNSDIRLRSLLFLLLGISVALAIIFLKKASEKTADDPADYILPKASSPSAPDMTMDTAFLTAPAETISIALPDTIGKDKRPAAEAGFEDGYLSGMDDGAIGEERASYDESNNLPTRTEREAYVKGYREGYAKGFEDGSKGKQFNI